MLKYFNNVIINIYYKKNIIFLYLFFLKIFSFMNDINKTAVNKIFHDMGNIVSYFVLYKELLYDEEQYISKDKILEFIDQLIINFNIMKYSFDNFSYCDSYIDDIYSYFTIKKSNIKVKFLFNPVPKKYIVVITNILNICLKNRGMSVIDIKKKDSYILICFSELNKNYELLYEQYFSEKNENYVFLKDFIIQNKINIQYEDKYIRIE